MQIYNTQQLLFDKTEPILISASTSSIVPDLFYTEAHTILSDIHSPDQARDTIETFISQIDTTKLPIYHHFSNRIQLAKADIIPVCGDSVTTSFQALHYDMGQPIISSEPQTMYVIIGLYFPYDTPAGTAKTRLLPLTGLLSDSRFGGKDQVESTLVSYVQEHGDGWADVNTYRLSCFARVIDAVAGTEDLVGYRDKTMAQWFSESENQEGAARLANEHAFYAQRQVPIEQKEKQIQLQPGQLLIIDNMRAVHGRVGKRREKEIYQFMYGVETAQPQDIDQFRKLLVSELTM